MSKITKFSDQIKQGKRDIVLKTRVLEAKACTRCKHERKEREKPYKRLSLDGELIAYLCPQCEADLRAWSGER